VPRDVGREGGVAMYERKAGSSSRRIAVTGRSDQYVYFASQQAMKASACAVFSAARRCGRGTDR
jgi:hypothetical protein